jgi:hypothetical protein
MSLNWRIGDVKNYREVCYERVTAKEAKEVGTSIDELLAQSSFMGPNWYTPGESDQERLANSEVVERLSPLTNCLIWATMSVDLRGITEENYSEFWLRICLLEKLTGHFLMEKDEAGEWGPRKITLAEVKSHIGLSCNVSPLSWREWLGRTMDRVRTDTLKSVGVKDTRSESWAPKLSQVATDTEDQMSVFVKALEQHDLDEDDEERRRHDRDLGKAYKAVSWLADAADTWQEIEERLEAELEAAEAAEEQIA